MKLTFLGANHEVTGSRTLLEWNEGRFLLVDEGMTQGDDEYENAPLPVSPERIEYVLLTHAHIDHSGMLPLLVRQGFRGKIYATAETTNLCAIMLADSASIQEKDAEHQTKKNLRVGKEPVEPLYTAQDAENAMKLFRPCEYHQIIPVDEGLSIRFNDAGHLMGSSSIECFLTEDGKQVTMVFSGDVGNTDQPIINDPCPVAGADYLMIESTYGSRLHDRRTDPIPFLTEILEKTFARGGSVIIPSFAIGRTQELLYFFREIKMRNLLPAYPDFPVYVDSPLSNEATAIFLQCSTDCLDEDARAIMRQGENPIWFDGLQTIVSVEESKALNQNRDPKVIIASGGMCEGGRIRHHLKHNLWNAANTVLFVGYQANGTLGRIIYDGAKEVKILGEEIKVQAEIALLNGVSGHADQDGLLRWVEGMGKKPARIFVNHGDDESCEALAGLLTERFGLPAEAPYSGSVFDLLKGEWIRLEPPVRKKKAPAKKEEKRKPAEHQEYKQLLAAAESLLAHVKTMDQHANGEIRKLTRAINDLIDSSL
ncbi:MAG: MBL fold metallo-hydrolase [Clostridia bacterium]|nr:MBL fold metallo-hydrolase [Clostridia bacterium]